MSRSAPALSVVLPVLDEARDLPRLLEEVLAQQPPAGGFEVLVADGGSTDGTQDVVRSYADHAIDVRLLDNPRRLSSAGRNVGARAARGTWVLFLDGHCAIPRRDYFVRVVELFESTGAACLARPQPLDQLHDRGWGEAISKARHSWLGHDAGSDIYGAEPGPTDPRSAGAAYRRDCLEELGFYDERFDACEDVEFNHRVFAAGKLSWCHPDLAIHYRPRSSVVALYRQMKRYGRGRGRLLARHGVIPLPLVVITLGVVFAIVVGIVFGPRLGLWTFGVPALAWVLLAAVESLRVAGSLLLAPRVFLAFVAIFAGLVFGFWQGLGDFPRYRRPPVASEG